MPITADLAGEALTNRLAPALIADHLLGAYDAHRRVIVRSTNATHRTEPVECPASRI